MFNYLFWMNVVYLHENNEVTLVICNSGIYHKLWWIWGLFPDTHERDERVVHHELGQLMTRTWRLQPFVTIFHNITEMMMNISSHPVVVNIRNWIHLKLVLTKLIAVCDLATESLGLHQQLALCLMKIERFGCNQ